MRGCRALLTLGLVCLLTRAGWGQPVGSQVQDLQRQILNLQEKLQSLEKGERERPRITQLGSSRQPVEEREREPELIVRIYDLSDLFTVAPPYPAYRSNDLGALAQPVFPLRDGSEVTGAGAMGMGGMGGMGGFFSVPGQTPGAQPAPRHILPQMFAGGSVQSPRTSMDDLIQAITSTIEPTKWDSVGGPCAIAQLGTAMLISATSQMHEQIENLLDSFRKRWGTLRTISLEADWLWLTKTQLASLLTARQPKPGEPPAFGLIDETAWQKLVEQSGKDGGQQRAGYHAVVTCYNGQVAHAISGGQSLTVVGMVPVDFSITSTPPPTVPSDAGKDKKGDAPVPAVPTPPMVFNPFAYQPVMATLQEGAVLQVMPIASISGKYVAVDVHSRVTHQTPTPQGAAVAGAPASSVRDMVSAIDRPRLTIQHLETTLRIPADRRMLVGGMTFESQPVPGSPNLYMFLKVTVQELRDEVAQRDAQAQPDLKVPAQPRPAKRATPAVKPAAKPAVKAKAKPKPPSR